MPPSRARTTPPSRRGTRRGEAPESEPEIRSALQALGIVPSRRWGQSFLTDPYVADAEAALVGPDTAGGVVEIGGGLGILTGALLRREIGPLTVLERDPRLASFLRRTFGHRIRVLTEDALAVPVAPESCYVGNLPYSVATPILVRLMAAGVPRIVFLVQREVAERLAAGPGSKAYGRLSIIARLYGQIELFRTVPPDAFTPRPDVESRLATFERRTGPLPVPSVAEFERIVRTLFSSRRKQLGNLLPRLTPTSDAAEALARAARWPEGWSRQRPEDLSPDDYFGLARALARSTPARSKDRPITREAARS